MTTGGRVITTMAMAPFPATMCDEKIQTDAQPGLDKFPNVLMLSLYYLPRSTSCTKL